MFQDDSVSKRIEDLLYHLERGSKAAMDATRNKGHRYERSKDATNGAPGLSTRSKGRY